MSVHKAAGPGPEHIAVSQLSVSTHSNGSQQLRMAYRLVIAFVFYNVVVAEELMDLTRVQRGALFIRLPARKFIRPMK